MTRYRVSINGGPCLTTLAHTAREAIARVAATLGLSTFHTGAATRVR